MDPTGNSLSPRVQKVTRYAQGKDPILETEEIANEVTPNPLLVYISSDLVDRLYTWPWYTTNISLLPT